MAGIASVLNTAKEALLAHQASVNVAGHNIANVNTPGYTRQVLDLTTPEASPGYVGFFGNGVRADAITRQYDQFMVKRLTDQNSTIKNLEAMQQSLRVVETIFNEAPGLAVNDLLSQFWESWQELTNNPELSSSRQAVVQQAELLNDQFATMSDEIFSTRTEIKVNLKSCVSDVNTLTAQLADLNYQISSSESEKQKQNDLRDNRDALLKDLSGLVDINYFETSSGAYTIMLNDGHTLVEQNENWSIDWADSKMYWLNINSEGVGFRTELDKDASLGGTIGGLLEINGQLEEGQADNYLGRLNALANSLVREVNQQHTQGVGTTRFADNLSSTELARDTALLHTTVDISTATDTIAEGTFTINGIEVGKIEGAAASFGLATNKAFNSVTAINNSYTGTMAKLTTQVAGDAVTAMVDPGDDNTVLDFTVNGIDVSYTVDTQVATPNDTDQATLAVNVVNAINTAIDTYNNTNPQTNIPPEMTIEAFVGNGLNGGALNSIVLKNTNAGDESQIVIAGIETDNTQPLFTAENNLGLTNGTYTADATHNTGEISLFANESPFTIEGGPDDRYLSQLGWGSAISYTDQAVTPLDAAVGDFIDFTINGTTIRSTAALTAGEVATPTALADAIVLAINAESNTTGVTAEVGNGTNGGVADSIIFSSSTNNIIIENADDAADDFLGFGNFTKRSVAVADEKADDGVLTYGFSDYGVSNSLMGYDYADQLATDGTSFKMWIYDSNNNPTLTQPVTVSLERAYDLQDVANAINIAVNNAIDDPSVTTPWVSASVVDNKLIFTPDSDHKFAFGGDTSNFLATAGINTFFTGDSIESIGINSEITEDLSKLAAGTINQFGEIFTGDNSNAISIANIQSKESVAFYGGTTDTLDGHYNSLVAEIGLSSRSVETSLEFTLQVSEQLNKMRDATSGVSLDEEMANLIKFQHAYSAAAKLITSSDEMMQTLLNAV